MVRSIALNCGKVTLVDDDDYALASGYRWTLKRNAHCQYAWGWANGKKIFLHRFLLNPKPTELIDHVDGNGLNNSRSNLRVVTPSQNQSNRQKWVPGTSTHRGIHWDDGRKRWRARVQIDGKRYLLGSFKTELEAKTKLEAATKRNQARR